MILTAAEFCPSVDTLTLLQFRSEAFQAWMDAPPHQNDEWRQAYGLIAALLDQANAGPITLTLR